MGLFDFLTGNAAPQAGVRRLSPDQLYQRLLALRDPAGGWFVRPAQGEGGADLIGDWGPVTITLRNILGETGMRHTKRVLMKLDPAGSMVRSLDQDGTVRWEAGIDGFSFQRGMARGQSRTIGGKWTLGGTSDGGFGLERQQAFDTEAMKRVLRATVADSGWGWKGVIFGRL